MSKIEEFDIIKKSLFTIISTSPLYKNKKVFAFFIKNGKAGGLINKAKTQKYLKTMKEVASSCSKNQLFAKAVDVSIMETQSSRHAQVFTQSIVDMAVSNREDNEYLILSAGGDGTSWEIQSILIKNTLKDKKTAKVLKEKLAFLQLALGTGNDGADGKNLKESLSFLTEGKSFVNKKAVMLHANKEIPELCGETAFSFNIASMGIDAFINDMTNKTKNFLPGNFYKLWVNLSVLFYEAMFPPYPIHLSLYDDKNDLIKSFNDALLFVVFGSSGKRSYGGGHKILPYNENFCIAKSIPTLQKILSANSFKDGTHYDKDFCYLKEVHKLVINYDHSIFMQIDGEVAFLEKDHFPVTLELVPFNIKRISK